MVCRLRRHLRSVAPAVLLAGTAAVAIVAAVARADDVVYIRPTAAGPATLPAAAAEEAAAAATEAKLAAAVKDVKFDAAPFGQACDALAKQAGVNVFVDWKALEEAGIGRDARASLAARDASAAEALGLLLREVSTPTAYLGYEVRGNVVWVSTQEHLSRRTVIRVYDLADVVQAERARWRALHPPRPRPAEQVVPLPPPVVPPAALPGQGLPPDVVPPPPVPLPIPQRIVPDAETAEPQPDEPTAEQVVEEVMALITTTVSPDQWRDNGGMTGVIKVLNGRLIIEQTRTNHQRIAAVLAALRATAQPSTRPVTIDVGAGG